MSHTVLSHEWQGQIIGVEAVSDDGRVSLEIARLNKPVPMKVGLDDGRAERLRRAVSWALELDARLARLVRQAEIVRLDVKPPQPRTPSRLRTVDETTIQRPHIEELIAPLIFHLPRQSSLRPFQEAGVRWLKSQRVGILADDMGLGKTAQALRALKELVEQGVVKSALVICPKSLVANWEAECLRWAPELTVVRVVPTKGEANAVWSAILGRSHVIITNYEQLRALPSPLCAERLELVIADEAHRLRSSQAKLVKAFRTMDPERIWALTGTPIERNEQDLATLLSLLQPTRFSIKSATSEPETLRAQARPYLLRRMKKDVLAELPSVMDNTEVVELTLKQQQAYRLACSRPLVEQRDNALKRLTLMRSICDADLTTGASTKLDRVMEILEAIQNAKEKAVIFSYLLQPLNELARRLAKVRPALRAISLTGKLTHLEREQAVSRFKTDGAIVALLCSSRVGGEGLTLTEANHVIFVNEWWNPSANAQSRDRVVRIGQKKVVHVHRFRCRGTVEEILDEILARKTKTFTDIVDALATGKELTDTQSEALLKEAVNRLDRLPL